MSERLILISVEEYQKLQQLASGGGSGGGGGGKPEENLPAPELKDRKNSILELLPKRFQSSAEQIINAFEQRNISWDNTSGTIAINGSIIHRSNIVDLLRVLLTPAIRNTDLPGLQELVLFLYETNFPLLLVKNPEIRKIVAGSNTSATAAAAAVVEKDNQTEVKQINWQKWD